MITIAYESAWFLLWFDLFAFFISIVVVVPFFYAYPRAMLLLKGAAGLPLPKTTFFFRLVCAI